MVGTVKAIYALGIHIIQKRKCSGEALIKIRSFAVDRSEGIKHFFHRSAEYNTGYGLIYLRKGTVKHGFYPPVFNRYMLTQTQYFCKGHATIDMAVDLWYDGYKKAVFRHGLIYLPAGYTHDHYS